VQAAIQDKQVRVTGKSRTTIQTRIALVKKSAFDNCRCSSRNSGLSPPKIGAWHGKSGGNGDRIRTRPCGNCSYIE